MLQNKDLKLKFKKKSLLRNLKSKSLKEQLIQDTEDIKGSHATFFLPRLLME